jgi:hypothetical protein
MAKVPTSAGEDNTTVNSWVAPDTIMARKRFLENRPIPVSLTRRKSRPIFMYMPPAPCACSVLVASVTSLASRGCVSDQPSCLGSTFTGPRSTLQHDLSVARGKDDANRRPQRHEQVPLGAPQGDAGDCASAGLALTSRLECLYAVPVAHEVLQFTLAARYHTPCLVPVSNKNHCRPDRPPAWAKQDRCIRISTRVSVAYAIRLSLV